MSSLNKTQSKRALTIAETAEYCCVSRGTVQNWIVSGLLPFEALPGRGNGARRFRLIRKQDLDVFLNENYHKANNKSINNNSDELILMEK